MAVANPEFKIASSLIGNRTRTDYYLHSNSRLQAYVDNVVRTGRKGIIQQGELTGLAERIDAKKTMRTLPKGLSEEDFLNTLRLSLLTECATDTYSRVYLCSAQKYNQPWLGYLIENVWVPDEQTHHFPFKIMLMDLGFSEERLDKEIRDAREADYIHEVGTTPAHLTTFGTHQEYMTDNWYGLQWKIFRPLSQEAAHIVARIKQRETLHTIWDRDLTALQVEENPDLITHVAEASMRFRMPGNQIIPELQSKAVDWMPFMGADFMKMKKDLIKLTAQIARSPEKAGRLVMGVAEQQELKFGPISISQVNVAMNRFGSPGYGLIGEALMVVAGMKEPFADNKGGIVGGIRGSIRNWLAAEIDKRLASKAISIPTCM